MIHVKAIPEIIIKLAFHLSVWVIERVHTIKLIYQQVDELRKLEKGTLGKEVADCLGKHTLRLVPGYESHDLKHSLLGYKMSPIDEIRMQAFMIGNGNNSIPSLAIFAFGFILLPCKWRQFARTFNWDFILNR